MGTAAKTKKTKADETSFDKAFDLAMEKAMAAKPKDIKVHISLRLDSDLYMELQRRAEAGEGDGMYQRVLLGTLREALFPREKSAGDRLIEKVFNKRGEREIEIDGQRFNMKLIRTIDSGNKAPDRARLSSRAVQAHGTKKHAR